MLIGKAIYFISRLLVIIDRLNGMILSTRNDISAYQPSIISKIASNIIDKASTKTLPNRLYILNDLKANSELKDQIVKKPIPYERDIRAYTLKLSRKQKRKKRQFEDEPEDEPEEPEITTKETTTRTKKPTRFKPKSKSVSTHFTYRTRKTKSTEKKKIQTEMTNPPSKLPTIETTEETKEEPQTATVMISQETVSESYSDIQTNIEQSDNAITEESEKPSEEASPQQSFPSSEEPIEPSTYESIMEETSQSTHKSITQPTFYESTSWSEEDYVEATDLALLTDGKFAQPDAISKDKVEPSQSWQLSSFVYYGLFLCALAALVVVGGIYGHKAMTKLANSMDEDEESEPEVDRHKENEAKRRKMEHNMENMKKKKMMMAHLSQQI